MTCGLVHACYSLPEWQAVKLTFFAPCIEFILTATYSLSLLFGQSSLNTVSSTMYLSSFEVCMWLEFIPHPISLFSIMLLRTPDN